MKNILKKLTNTKTVLAIVSMVVLILMTLGVDVDNEQIDTITKAICTILVLLGIMNCDGMEEIKWDK